jgi:hypothetical protein
LFLKKRRKASRAKRQVKSAATNLLRFALENHRQEEMLGAADPILSAFGENSIQINALGV